MPPDIHLATAQMFTLQDCHAIRAYATLDKAGAGSQRVSKWRLRSQLGGGKRTCVAQSRIEAVARYAYICYGHLKFACGCVRAGALNRSQVGAMSLSVKRIYVQIADLWTARCTDTCGTRASQLQARGKLRRHRRTPAGSRCEVVCGRLGGGSWPKGICLRR